MLLITKKQAQKLPTVEEAKKQKDPIAYVKVFNPYGVGTWYICGKTGDLLWGLVELQGKELGCFSYAELQEIRVRPFYLRLERDMWFEPTPISELTGKKVAI